MKKVIVIIACIAIVVGVGIAIQVSNDENETTNTTESLMESSSVEESTAVESTEETLEEEETESETEQSEVEATEEVTTQQQTETQLVEIETQTVHYENYEKEEASYEEWLVAATLTSIAMNYFDFSNESFYIASNNDLNGKKNSLGIYIVFTSGGEELCVKAQPLEKARTESGTKDIYSATTGYASFEIVSKDTLDMSVYKATKIKDLNTLIQQLEQVVLYEN